ncbi:MAG: hypothetical protein H7Z37_15670 [Pyrinomonadaceae bacterium]|nr:hypothetical protein [Pyrinomonadaceae bacterium]
MTNFSNDELLSQIFTPNLRETGEKLLHHQCWCWGKDILYPNGNLLIKRGFERVAVRKGKTGNNAYSLQLEDSRQLVLWGFGIAFADEMTKKSVFFERYNFAPQIIDAPRIALPVCSKDELCARRFPRCSEDLETSLKLTIDLLRFLILYENWVEKSCGSVWRRNVLRGWENAALTNAEMQRGWRKLLRTLEKQRQRYV